METIPPLLLGGHCDTFIHQIIVSVKNIINHINGQKEGVDKETYETDINRLLDTMYADAGNIREENNALKESINVLTEENAALKESMNRMEKKIETMMSLMVLLR